MKRILSLALIVLLLPALLAVPAMAAESDDDLLNVLDYGFPNGGTTTLVGVTPANNTVNFDLPFSTQVNYIDIVVSMTSLQPTAIYLVSGGSEVLLTKTTIFGRVYRIYGQGNSNITGDFDLRFEFAEGATGTSWVTFKSVKVSLVPMRKYEMSAVGTVYDYSTSPSTNTPITYQGDGVSHTVDLYASSTTHNSFRAELVLYDWQKYDYVDVLVGTFCQNIASVDVQLAGKYVPFEYNCISSVDGNNTTLFIVSVRIDLRSVTRSATDELLFQLSATTPINVASSFSITSVVGSVVTDVPDVNSYWWMQLEGWLSDMTDSIVNALGGNNDSSQVTDNISSAVGELGEVQNVMDGVSRPALDSIDFDVSGMVDTAAVATYGNIFSKLIGNQYMTNILMLAFILAAASFLLFGRR